MIRVHHLRRLHTHSIFPCALLAQHCSIKQELRGEWELARQYEALLLKSTRSLKPQPERLLRSGWLQQRRSKLWHCRAGDCLIYNWRPSQRLCEFHKTTVKPRDGTLAKATHKASLMSRASWHANYQSRTLNSLQLLPPFKLSEDTQTYSHM